MRLCHVCLPRTALVMCLHCWRQDAGLDRLVIWDTTIFHYVPSLIFFFWVQFVSVLVILAFSLLSHRDCWFRPADCWDRDSGVLHPGNYDSPWNCILGSHLAGDPAGHFTTQLPLPALLLVTLQSLLLSLLLLLFEHLETSAVVPSFQCARCCRLERGYLHIVDFGFLILFSKLQTFITFLFLPRVCLSCQPQMPLHRTLLCSCSAHGLLFIQLTWPKSAFPISHGTPLSSLITYLVQVWTCPTVPMCQTVQLMRKQSTVLWWNQCQWSAAIPWARFK